MVLQLELIVYLELEAANKASNALLETQHRGSDAFKASLIKYETLYHFIQTNQKNGVTSEVLESYLLEVKLVTLQTKENCLTESPANEAALLKNEQKLEEIKKSLVALYLRADRFYTALKSKRSKSFPSSSFLLDCKETVDSIKAYHASWSNLSNRTKANYCYNFANTLIEQSKNETENSRKITVLKQARDYIVSAMAFYAAIGDKGAAKSTKVFLKQVKFSLNNLGAKETKKRKVPPTSVESTAKLTKFAASSSENREITRQYQDIQDEREITWKKILNKCLIKSLRITILYFIADCFLKWQLDCLVIPIALITKADHTIPY